MTFKKNAIYCGDCTKVLHKHIPDNSIDLIYVDPPFFSNKNYEIIWKDGAEIRAFEDRWKGGIQHYIKWMEPKIRECHRVLKEDGNFYLHCDKHANAYLRRLCDNIFGKDQFRNEIIWHYRKMSNPKNRFAQNHDTILRYTKGQDNTHHSLYDEDRTRALYNRFKTIVDRDDKLRWRQAKKRDQQLLDHYVDRKRDELNRELQDDDVIIDFSDPEDKYKQLDDVWDIPILKGNSKEHLGYPTQKPIELLEHILKASSNPTDVVLDPMCGSGTALVAAKKLGRNYIGIDINPKGIEISKKRLKWKN